MRDGEAPFPEPEVFGKLSDPEHPEPFSAASLHGLPVPRRLWHVRGLIPARAVTLLGGAGGAGKSTLALQLCVATCSKTTWLGLEPRRGPCLYLSAEDDKDELHRRLDGLSVFYGTPIEHLADLRLWDLTEHEAALSETLGASDAIRKTDLWPKLEQWVDGYEPTLIVLDAVADVFAGNENVRSQVRQFIGFLRGLAIKSNAAVLLLAHPSLEGIKTGSGLSGSTAWNNSVRSRLFLSSPDPGNPDALSLSVMKANYAPTGLEIHVRRQGGGYGVVGAGETTVLDLSTQRARIDETFIKLLSRYEAQQRVVSDKPGSNYAPVMFARESEAKPATKKGLEEAMNRLFNRDLIGIRMTGPPSRRTRQLVCKNSCGPRDDD